MTPGFEASTYLCLFRVKHQHQQPRIVFTEVSLEGNLVVDNKVRDLDLMYHKLELFYTNVCLRDEQKFCVGRRKKW